MCGIDVRKRAFHTLEKCKEFFVWFSGSDECVEKCEEIRSSQFHTSKMWGNWRWAGEMWGNPFLTSENVRKYSKSLLAINFNVRKMWGIFHMCGIDVRKRAFGPQTPKTTLWVNLSELGFFFYHDRLWCSGDLEVELQCHVTETNFLCAGNRLGVRHQPSIWSSKRLTSQAPQVPPGFQACSTLRSWLCTSTDAQSAGPVLYYSVFPAKGRDLLRAMIATTLAMSSWLSGMERNFAEKLDLCYFSFHAADFPSSAILNSFQELCHRTRRLKSSFARNGYPCSRYDVLVARSTRCCQPISSLPARPRALHCCMHAWCTRAFAIDRAREKQRRGMAWARGLPSLVAISPSFRALVSSWRMIASSSSLSSSLFCQFYPSASAGVAHPDWGQRLVDVLVRAKFFCCCDVRLRSLG